MHVTQQAPVLGFGILACYCAEQNTADNGQRGKSNQIEHVTKLAESQQPLT